MSIIVQIILGVIVGVLFAIAVIKTERYLSR